jgi:hypothetical protein
MRDVLGGRACRRPDGGATSKAPAAQRPELGAVRYAERCMDRGRLVAPLVTAAARARAIGGER